MYGTMGVVCCGINRKGYRKFKSIERYFVRYKATSYTLVIDLKQREKSA